MAKYKKKPIVVEAWQWSGERPLPEPLVGNWDNNPMTPNKVSIETINGYVDIEPGEYIIRGVRGEYYPCKPDIFEKTYELIEE